MKEPAAWGCGESTVWGCGESMGADSEGAVHSDACWTQRGRDGGQGTGGRLRLPALESRVGGWMLSEVRIH